MRVSVVPHLASQVFVVLALEKALSFPAVQKKAQMGAPAKKPGELSFFRVIGFLISRAVEARKRLFEVAFGHRALVRLQHAAGQRRSALGLEVQHDRA